MAERLSTQRRYQLKHRRLGLCYLCPRPVVKSQLCEEHYIAQALRNRERYRRLHGTDGYPQCSGLPRVKWHRTNKPKRGEGQ